MGTKYAKAIASISLCSAAAVGTVAAPPISAAADPVEALRAIPFLATPPATCSVIAEPGVTMNFYDNQFPDAPPVGHSDLRSNGNTTGWVVRQLSA